MTTPEKPRSMDDPDAPPTEEELRDAEALRTALEAPIRVGGENNDDADFARALALAHHPRPLSAGEHRAIVERTLSRLDEGNAAPKGAPEAPAKRGGMLVRVAFGATAALSLAAAFVLFVKFGPGERSPKSAAVAAASMVAAPVAETKLARVRSTQSLFPEPFPAAGGTSARIDRIALARASDLRDNRFAHWGVR